MKIPCRFLVLTSLSLHWYIYPITAQSQKPFQKPYPQKPSGLNLDLNQEIYRKLSKCIFISPSGPFEYNLRVNADVSTKGHTQWYFFSIQNMKPGVRYQFNITNLMKKRSLYGQGMQPLMYSDFLHQEKELGWHRVGSRIRYFKNSPDINPNTKKESKKQTFTLTFTVTFPASSDTVYFAHCFPYTYTMLQKYINTIANDPEKSEYVRHRVVGKTILGNKYFI